MIDIDKNISLTDYALVLANVIGHSPLTPSCSGLTPDGIQRIQPSMTS